MSLKAGIQQMLRQACLNKMARQSTTFKGLSGICEAENIAPMT